MEAVRAPYKEVYKPMQKAKQTQFTTFYTKYSVSQSAKKSTLFYHHHNFQPGKLTSFQYKLTQMFCGY
jgi:hypothetical protein